MVKILELKIVLSESKPTIYRTVQIEDNRTFFELHLIIQTLFAWDNSHLHIFELDHMQIGLDNLELENLLDERAFRLSQANLHVKKNFHYTYDFGDNWIHEIKVMKIVEPKNNGFYPKCIRGARNAPVENCGGIYGLEDFKKIMANENHPEHQNMKAWHGGNYDANLFLLPQINNKLAKFHLEATRVLTKEHGAKT